MTRHQTNQPRTSKGNLNSSSQATNQSNLHHTHRKVIHFEPFSLHSPDNESLKRAAELVEEASLNRHRVCVVSIISKDALDGSTKSHLLRSLTSNKTNIHLSKEKKHWKRNHQNNANNDQGAKVSDTDTTTQEDSQTTVLHNDNMNASQIDEYENQVVGQVDSRSGLIVLNLTSFMEADKLHLLSENISQSANIARESTSSLFETWPLLNQNLIKTLLVLLTVSHIVVFYSPEISIDFSLIHMLKVINHLRLKSETRITDLLETIASKQMFPAQWIRQGRVTCPRALFVCDATQLGREVYLDGLIDIKRDIEDHIYKLLKRLNIITRPAAVQGSYHQSDLLCLPERDDFVFVLTHQDVPTEVCELEARDISLQEKEKALNDFYQKLFESLDLSAGRKQSEREEGSSTVLKQQVDEQPGGLIATKFSKNHGSRLKKFLHRHISDIQSNLKDHEVKQPINRQVPLNQVQLMLPRYDDFFAVLLGLESLLFAKTEPNYEPAEGEDSEVETMIKDSGTFCWRTPDERRFVDIYDLNNNDEQFSKAHCSKTRQAAFEYYVGKATKHMDSHKLEDLLTAALGLYGNHARGPACHSNRELLIAQCLRHNESLRRHHQVPRNQTAKHNQLSTNNCVNSVASTSFKPNLAILRRASGVKMTTSCECGRQTSFSITPADRKKRLERINVIRCDDDKP